MGSGIDAVLKSEGMWDWKNKWGLIKREGFWDHFIIFSVMFGGKKVWQVEVLIR